MKVSPWFLGAAAVVPIAGAVIGSHMSTDPVGQRADVTETLPVGSTAVYANANPRTSERLPDHYAMETPEGVVEVKELAMRGRYRDRYRTPDSYDHSYEEEIDTLEARWDSDRLDARAQRALAPSPAPVARTSHNAVPTAQPEAAHYAAMEQARTGEDFRTETTQVADGVIEIQPAEPAIGNARVIDVAGELSALD